MDKKKVLFICVENSCRSQIAEGLARRLGGDVLEPWSAGSKPSGKVNPTAVALMKERGVDLGIQKSKGLSDLPVRTWDYVFTMGCGDVCPFVPSRAGADWGIADPKSLPREEFLEVIAQIEVKVIELIGAVKAEVGR